MKTISVPDNLIKEEELVVIPRRDYEQMVSDLSKDTVERNLRIDKRLNKSLNDVKKGRVHGPFLTADEGIAFLRNYRGQSKKK